MTRTGHRNDPARSLFAVTTILILASAFFFMGHRTSGAQPGGEPSRGTIRITSGPPDTKAVRAGRSVPFRLRIVNPGGTPSGPVRICIRLTGIRRNQASIKDPCDRFHFVLPGRFKDVRWRLKLDPAAEGIATLKVKVFHSARIMDVKTTTLRILTIAPKPAFRKRLIPFGTKRKHEMARYSKRHYGRTEWRLGHPKQIVEHYAVASTLGQIYNTFRPDHPDAELNELPNTCSHFAVDGKGRIQQFVKLGIRCRHVVGLNHVTIGIEHTGFSDGQVLHDRQQMKASLKLTQWLRCRYSIKLSDVIGHNESLSSRFHYEKIKRLRHQTHGDFKHQAMRHYRKRLRALGPC